MYKVMQNQVHILFTGYSHDDPLEQQYKRANCSCTLIRTRNGCNIIVDTMTAWNGERLVAALKSYQLQPDNINYVVCTHGHSDHIGCNYLFTKAKWHFVGACASHDDKYLDWGDADDATFQLDGDDVVVVRTPGHTAACVSVLVKNTPLGKLVGICGDLFEREEDIEETDIWFSAGSEKLRDQVQQRLRMAKMCDYIIPGHGAGFAVNTVMRKKLQEDIMNFDDSMA